MKMTLKEAADAVGRNKSTVFRAIQDGKLGATKNENGLIFIDSEELVTVYPPEDSENRMQIRKRGRPAGSKKKPNSANHDSVIEKELLRVQQLNIDYKEKIELMTARTKADEVRISDLMIERERMNARISQLERDLDIARSESSAKDSRVFELRSEKEKISSRLEAMERNLERISNAGQGGQDGNKKGIFRKIFAS
ncbi:MAG: hypothetical protein AAF621_06785 [Pseudomonadota bacterium]